MKTRAFLLASAFAVAAGLGAACGSASDSHDVAVGGAERTARPAEVTYDEHGEPEGLHRFRKWSDRIVQGAQPEGEAAFRNLAAMGVTTMISVDGARPDLENAKKYGIRYVHVPIGYHGLQRPQQLEIVKAVQLSEGAAFVHCHHGKHRGPAAAMVARMAIDGVDTASAVEGLRESGCSPKYAGLYTDVETFVVPSEAELAAVSEDLPEYVSPPAIVDAMLDVDFRSDNLKACREAGWDVPPGDPDVSPAHEARMMWEHYREMRRLDQSKELGDDFLGLLEDSEEAAVALEESLRAGDREGAETAWTRVLDGCQVCHSQYRNTR